MVRRLQTHVEAFVPNALLFRCSPRRAPLLIVGVRLLLGVGGILGGIVTVVTEKAAARYYTLV